MSNQRHDDDRLVEIEAVLEQLRQIKEDTVTMIMKLREAARNRETQTSSWTRVVRYIVEAARSQRVNAINADA